MAKRKSSGKGTAPSTLRVHVDLQDLQGEDRPSAAAYAYSRAGALVARAALDRKGQASLDVPDGLADRSLRLAVGPDLEGAEPRLAELRRRGAVERLLEPGARAVELLVPSLRWEDWFCRRCHVPGRLLKSVQAGEETIRLPVPNATVEVWEVDPWTLLIPRLPDDVIGRIRDIVIAPDLPFPPEPIPRDPFPPEPFPPEPPFPPGPGPGPGPFARAAPSPAGGARPGEMAPGSPGAPPVSPDLGDLQLLARTANVEQFRQILPDYQLVLWPLLCGVIHPWVTMQKVAEAVTDADGNFHASFCRGVFNADIPDLYFRARQTLPGTGDTVIYAPTPVPCHTRWNYACGTPVTLTTDDSRARTSAPPPDVVAPPGWVLFTAVGNISPSRIHGASAALAASTTPANEGLVHDLRWGIDGAFGGHLRFRLEFDNDLIGRTPSIRYYRVSYRRGTSGAFVDLDGAVDRHYTEEQMVGGSLVLTLHSYSLGPRTVGSTSNLFEIPPADPADLLVSPPAPGAQWSHPNAVEDLTNARFPSHLLSGPGQEGLHQFKVELFDETGTLVDASDPSENVTFFVPDTPNLAGTITTTDAASLGLTDGAGMVLTLRVDNRPCQAAVGAPELGGSAAADSCGVLRYTGPGESVTFPYTAYHPGGFGAYHFYVRRNTTTVVRVPTPPPDKLQTGPTPGHTETRTVAQLLGTCDLAGFVVAVDVDAVITNGWSLQHGLDRRDDRGLAIAPAPPAP